MIENKSITTSGLDPNDDAPELTEEWFARGALYIGGKLVRRGRPLGSGTRELVSLRIDKDALAAFRATGPGWQVRINETLKRSAKRLAKSQ
jgi:BrnA antitoxin of type II toxin-antitoxin system